MRVPIALIHQVCYPTSYRLPKLQRLVIEKPGVPTPTPHICAASEGYFKNQGGNLNNGDYRYFVGRVNKSDPVAQCRWCREPLMSQSLRKKHKSNKCQEKLTKVFREMLQGRHCATCGKHTTAENWGVPLCLGTCLDSFKFMMTNPLKMAIDKYKVIHNERLTLL